MNVVAMPVGAAAASRGDCLGGEGTQVQRRLDTRPVEKEMRNAPAADFEAR